MSLEAVGLTADCMWLTLVVARLTPDCLWEVPDESRDCWTDCRLPVGGPW